MRASFGAQETRCEILESTLGVHLGLSVLLGIINSCIWSILDAVAHLFIIRAFLYPSSNNNGWKRKKKVSVFFLNTSAAMFQFFWIWKMSLFLFYFLALLSMLFCIWPQKEKKCFLLLLLIILPIRLSFAPGSFNIDYLFNVAVRIYGFALHNPWCSIACLQHLTVPWIFRYCHRSNWKTRAEAAFRTLS